MKLPSGLVWQEFGSRIREGFNDPKFDGYPRLGPDEKVTPFIQSVYMLIDKCHLLIITTFSVSELRTVFRVVDSWIVHTNLSVYKDV